MQLTREEDKARTCEVCGAELPSGSLNCPGCGAVTPLGKEVDPDNTIYITPPLGGAVWPPAIPFKNERLVLRLVVLPYLYATTGLLLVYSVIDAYVMKRQGAWPVDEAVSNIFLPALMGFLLMMIVMRPRIHLIYGEQYETGRGRYFFHLLAWAGIALPTILFQPYVGMTSGGLTHVRSPREIEGRPFAQYFSIDQYRFDKLHYGIYHTTDVVTRRGGRSALEMTAYYVCPLTEDTAGNSGDDPSRGVGEWAGGFYENSVDNNLTPLRKQAAYSEFLKSSLQEFALHKLMAPSYFERVTSDVEIQRYRAAIATSRAHADEVTDPVILVPSFSAFDHVRQSSFYWGIGSCAISCLVWLAFVAGFGMDKSALKQFLSKRRNDQ